jgi:hypothetical protein
MAILAAAQRKNPELGYATDFVDGHHESQVLPDVVKRGIRVITNAGGINPQACAQALRALAAELGLAGEASPWCWATTCMPLVPALREAEGVRDCSAARPARQAAERQCLPGRAAGRSARWTPVRTSSSPAAASTAP